MQICNRVIFDKPTGVIIYQTGEHRGAVAPHPDITEIDFIDVPFGSIDYKNSYIESIDVSTQKPIIKMFPSQEAEEQRRIRELEDALLLQTDLENGGIL